MSENTQLNNYYIPVSPAKEKQECDNYLAVFSEEENARKLYESQLRYLANLEAKYLRVKKKCNMLQYDYQCKCSHEWKQDPLEANEHTTYTCVKCGAYK